MKKTALSLLTLMLAAFFMLPVAAHADPLLIPYSATVTPGQTFTLGEWIYIDPSAAGTVYFNYDSFTIDSPITLDDTPFVTSFPLSAQPGETAQGNIFTILVPAVIAPGLYTGSFSIFGGYDLSSTDELTRVQIALTVPGESAVPEPGTWVLLATGLGALAVVVYGRRRAAGFVRVA
jgi:hypothetical protein